MLDQELQKNIRAAADMLLQGGVVAFPTETVYGLGADAANPQALQRVFDIKKRPLDHPLIVHIGHAALLDYWAGAVPDAAWRLALHFWPGPLTLILPRRTHVLPLVSGGQKTVGLRVPDHPVAQVLLRSLGDDKGLAAPSANLFGRTSPTTAAHVRAGLGGSVDMVLDGGACRVGVESTIVGFTGDIPTLLRPGGIAVAALEAVLGEKVRQPDMASPAPRTPGSLPTHYSPTTQLEVWPAGALERRAEELSKHGLRVAILELNAEASPNLNNRHLFCFPMPAQATVYARILYATLHTADAANFDRILAEAPPQTPVWQTVHDRLRRASTLYCPTDNQPLETHHDAID